MEIELGRLLTERGYTVAVAESCTGGLVSARLIDKPGASAFFMEGAVTYSNASKIARLGVKAETIERFGAVSEETAREMSEGMARSAGTDIGISTTGIAGPDGGTPEKPVGLVYIGLCVKGRVSAERFVFSGPRERVRDQAADEALRMLRSALT